MQENLESKRTSMIRAAKEYAEQCGGVISAREFVRRSGFSRDSIYRIFPRGWTELREAAGIARNPCDPRRYSDEEILNAYHDVVSNLKKIPTRHDFNRHAQISWKVLSDHFGAQQGILTRYREWLLATEPESKLLQLIPVDLAGCDSNLCVPSPSRSSLPIQSPPIRRTVYGEPINFRGLRHAPVNEQGVVYLFGMVSQELGFLVEAVHSAFPDCEAKRCINPKDNRWQRVLIEFEFESRNFVTHEHHPEGCDLIVCWQHNWPACPLEVVELRQVLSTLDASK